VSRCAKAKAFASSSSSSFSSSPSGGLGHGSLRLRERERTRREGDGESRASRVLIRCAAKGGEERGGETVSSEEEKKTKAKWNPLRFAKQVLFFSPVKKVVLLPVTLPVRLVKKVVGAVVGRNTVKVGEGEGEGSIMEVFNNINANEKGKGEGEGGNTTTGVVLVAGATGGVGKRAVAKLLRRGRRVRALVRDLEKAKDMLSSEIKTGSLDKVPGAALELVAADITQPATLLPEMFEGVVGVICCTACKVAPKEGDTPARAKYYQGIKFFDPEIVGDTPEVVDYLGVKNLLEAVKSQILPGSEGEKVLGTNILQGGPKGVKLQWGALDDVVMGGVSDSRMEPLQRSDTDEDTEEDVKEGAVVFKGTVRTENNGGFCSTRTKNILPPLDLSAHDGLVLRVKGDGQRFKFLIRTDSGFDTIGYSTSFDTSAGVWQDVVLPFQGFTPVFRAKTLSAEEAEPLNPSNIVSMQMMLSKFEYDGDLNPNFTPGSFELPIGSLCTYQSKSKQQDTYQEKDQDAQGLSARFVYVSSAGVTRPNRPGIDVEVEPPAVKLNDTLGGILTYKLKGEDCIRSSGVPFSVVRPCALTEEPEGAELVVDQGDVIKGKISREDVADLCCSLLELPGSAGTTFEISSTVPFSQPFVAPDKGFAPRTNEEWQHLLRNVEKGVTGKTVEGVYSGKRKEQQVLEEATAAGELRWVGEAEQEQEQEEQPPQSSNTEELRWVGEDA